MNQAPAQTVDKIPLEAELGQPAIAAQGQGIGTFWVASLMALHLLLGVLCTQSRWIAFAHATATFMYGLYLILVGRSKSSLACWAAYVVGAEVLWRMSLAPLPWEFAKYTLSLVLLLGALRNGLKGVPWLPVAYFLLLLPAAIFTILELPPRDAKDLISFNLSGPFAVAVCALFFSRLQLDSSRIQRVVSWLIFPVVAIAAVALVGLLLSNNLQFGLGSNFAATGGFGPNQVSAAFGLGALYLVLMAFSLRLRRALRLLFMFVALWFCAHAVLSFSRTGVYLFGVSLLAALPFLSIKRVIHPVTLFVTCLAIVAGIGVWYYLVDFTAGKVIERFSQLGVTGRDRIAHEDLAIWRRNMVLGAGIGMSRYEREQNSGQRIAAHTEYTRLLAEHGVLGILAALLLIVAAVRNVLRRRPSFAKPAVIAGTVWALLYFAGSGIRTAAPALLLGLGLAQYSVLPVLSSRSRMLPFAGATDEPPPIPPDPAQGLPQPLRET